MVAPFSKFMAKFGFVFVLILQTAFSQRFHFQAIGKCIDSSKKAVQGIFKTALRLREEIGMFLYDDQ